MSSVRLLLSGSLVASGLILGTFTLYGAFDQPTAHKRGETGGRQQPQREPKGISAFQTRTRFEPGAKPADAASTEAKAARAAARRKLAEKRRAEKEKAEKEKAEKEKLAKAKEQPAPQQATLQWPWNWFGN
jgi:hypothetical protein